DRRDGDVDAVRGYVAKIGALRTEGDRFNRGRMAVLRVREGLPCLHDPEARPGGGHPQWECVAWIGVAYPSIGRAVGQGQADRRQRRKQTSAAKYRQEQQYRCNTSSDAQDKGLKRALHSRRRRWRE